MFRKKKQIRLFAYINIIVFICIIIPVMYCRNIFRARLYHMLLAVSCIPAPPPQFKYFYFYVEKKKI